MQDLCKELTWSSPGKDLSTNQMLFPGERHEQFCITNTSLGCGIGTRTQTRGKQIHLLLGDKLSETERKRRVSFPPGFVMLMEKSKCSNAHGQRRVDLSSLPAETCDEGEDS